MTGKGGTGKSWLSTQLAKEGALRGLHTVRVQVAAPGDNAEASPRQSPDGYDDVVLDEREALSDFLHAVVPLGFVAARLLSSRTFTAVAAAAPGIRDLVALASIARLSSGKDPYDLVIVDAPASGHSVPLVTSPARVAELVSFGPLSTLVEDLGDLVRNPERFVVLVVTSPEELAVVEAVELSAALDKAGVRKPEIVVNAVWPQHLDPVCARWLKRSQTSKDALVHLERQEREYAMVRKLEAQVGPTLKIEQHFGAPESPIIAKQVARVFDLATAAREEPSP